jgi:ferredoxin--NADP+ reductase
MFSVTGVQPAPSDAVLKIAIVGSGPSGFYAAEALLASSLVVQLDMLERLPSPYGLVRYGVAPDHPKLKSVTEVFARIAADPRFRFFGNVELGRDVDFDFLRSKYHAVVMATGAADDRKLDIPGEELRGVWAANDFVGWYNGHPDCSALEFDLSHRAAVVVGQGNVALDVCRILAKPASALRQTDIAAHALQVIERSQLQVIHLVGRRGPAQAKFTTKELRELASLEGWQLHVDQDALELAAACRTELAAPDSAQAAKNFELLRSLAREPERKGSRRIQLHFLSAPVGLNGDDGLASVELERQRLEGNPGSQRAVGTGERWSLDASLLFRCVGYRGRALPDVPFDHHRGVIPNEAGRILDKDGTLARAYVTGWIKRGPTGIIGTNRVDSIGTVAALMADLRDELAWKPGRAALEEHLRSQGRPVVSFDHWVQIEREEQRRGALAEKAAEKFTAIADMLAFVRTSTEQMQWAAT